MVKRLSEIRNLLNPARLKHDRRIVVFSVCLLIATALWFLNALGKYYTTTLSYPVKYINPPKNQFLANDPPSKFELNVEAYGFTLLRHKLAFSFSPILLNLTSIRQNLEGNGNTHTIRTGDLVRQISDQVSKEVKITDVTPKVITLVFDSLKTKKVCVRPVADIDLKPQFFLTDSVKVKPDSVEIKGPSTVLDTIFLLDTKPIKFSELNTTVEEVVGVSCPKNTIIMPDKVMLNITVARFTEKKFNIPVQVRSKPETGQIKLFPSVVNVSFLVNLNEYENITPDDFKAVVDYNTEKNDRESLGVIIESSPPNIKMLRITPDNVEFLIESN